VQLFFYIWITTLTQSIMANDDELKKKLEEERKKHLEVQRQRQIEQERIARELDDERKRIKALKDKLPKGGGSDDSSR
jgi:hypothetical protein